MTSGNVLFGGAMRDDGVDLCFARLPGIAFFVEEGAGLFGAVGKMAHAQGLTDVKRVVGLVAT
jgi:hypothetical protein